MNPENSARAERALFALRSYLRAKGEGFAHEDLEADITDLLADLRHLFEAHELCFGDLDRTAYAYYSAERGAGGAP